jgi:hypothetical protein
MRGCKVENKAASITKRLPISWSTDVPRTSNVHSVVRVSQRGSCTQEVQVEMFQVVWLKGEKI